MFPDMYQLPLATVDSSTWTAGRRFGRMSMFDKRNGLVGYSVGDMKQRDANKIPAPLKKKWVEMGLNPRDRMTPDYYAGRLTVNNFINTEGYLHLHDYTRQQGLEYFFVIGDVIDVANIACVKASHKALGRLDYKFVYDSMTAINNAYKADQPLTLLEEMLA